LGAMAAIQERGLTVGADIAVAGFDDIPAASLATPSLTTVSQPIYTIGRQLADALVKLMKNIPLGEQHVLLKPKLIVRESSGHIRHSTGRR
jgi:DNA-binding LacI/PurR family transcriptional regulator